jgi:predicted RNase H-like HicB family nuclease
VNGRPQQAWLAASESKRLPFAKRGAAMKYKIAIRESDEGFSVSVPGLPGCWSQGTTEPEALQNIQDAIKEYLATVEDLLEGATVREIDVSA